MILFLIVSVLSFSHGGFCDRAFDVFFTSNRDEMSEALIEFDQPLPSWLKGSLIRNGLGQFEVGSRSVTTALDGYAKLSKFTFPQNGGSKFAKFSTKFVKSKSFTASMHKGDIEPYMMLSLTIPPFNDMEMMFAMQKGPDNMNVNIFNYGSGNSSNYVIMSDYWRVYQINPNDLSTVKLIDPDVEDVSSIEKELAIGSGHPLREQGTDNYITFLSLMNPIPGMQSRYVISRATSAEKREKIAEIKVDKISYMHSFAMTENYVVLFAAPLYVDPLAVFRTFSPEDGFEWDGDKATVLYVVELKTGKVRKFETENMFYLHHVNAFENAKGNLEMDVVTYQNGDALRIMDFTNLLNSTTRSMFKPPIMKRYTLDLDMKTVEFKDLGSSTPSQYKYASTLDFPTINENYRCRSYCYVYGVVYSVNGSDFLDMALVKKDICTGKEDRAWYKKDSFFNEAWFVPRPGGISEDDGILLVDVVDSANKISSLVIFDAKTLTISSSAFLPTTNPFGTHGRFFDNVF